MSTITVSTECGTTKRFDNRHDAEAAGRAHTDLCEECGADDVDVSVDPNQATLRSVAERNGTERDATSQQDPDGSTSSGRSGGPHDPGRPDTWTGTQAAASADLSRAVDGRSAPDGRSALDGRSVLSGRSAIGDRGFAALAARLDIAVQSEPVTTAGETDHEYAEFRATAWKKEEGPECGYTGYATARAAEDRRGIEHNLNEAAETRAMERAVAWASGIGVSALDETGQGDERAVEDSAAPNQHRDADENTDDDSAHPVVADADAGDA